ncbi:ComF family protein [Vibrio sp. S9_S30]|uniref:ComF family protein n=1 Tax=Vibrio sp. S9_S30 TaxID=2720226 RepID=UPI0016805BF1|nr:phosphoribosyltransferase family protein [Vibrio sp. S9_S30]MBD1558647.1 ComF family protein [Vibrio sp. S9_S30]
MAFSHWLKLQVHRHFKLQCPSCGLNIEENTPTTRWCQVCLEDLREKHRCLQCGLPTLHTVEQCGQCLSTPPPWHRLYCVGDYQPPLSNYVHHFKHQHQFWLSDDLTYLLAAQISQPAEIITSVPLHWRRQLWRGYNQSDHLAKSLCQHLGVVERFDNQVFNRIKHTGAQQGLNRKARLLNLKNAFTLNSSHVAKHMAIVDDVVTTGSTIRQLCQLLLDVGVETVDIYCICRTPEPM